MRKRSLAVTIFLCLMSVVMTLNISNVGLANIGEDIKETVTPAVSQAAETEETPANTAEPYAGSGYIDSAIGKDSLKILAIGDKTTWDTFTYFPSMLEESTNIDFICARAYFDGELRFEHLWDYMENEKEKFAYEKTGELTQKNKKIEDILKDEQWDYIIVQEATDIAGVPEKTRPYVGNVVNFLREKCPSAELVYQETWAYEEYFFPDNIVFERYYDKDQKKMYSMVHEATKEICLDNNIKYIIPTGTAIQFARSNFGEVDYEERRALVVQEKHLSYAGSYLSALAWMECFTGIDARKISYNPLNLSDEFINMLERCTHIAVSGGSYGNLGDDPEKLPLNIDTEEYIPVGEPIWRYDMEDVWSSNAFGELGNVFGSDFIVSPKLVNDTAYKGKGSMYMKGSSMCYVAKSAQVFPVEPGKHYILKFWYKGHLESYCPYLNDEEFGMETVEISSDNEPTEEWTEVTYHFKTFKHVGNGMFGFLIYLNGNMEFWVDEMKMYEALPKSMVTPGPEIIEKSTREYVELLFPKPTPEPTPVVTAIPSTTPTATPNVPVAKQVKKVKFVKKSIKVKFGKKVILTLKVKLTPAKGLSKKAKKVKWSIDKKGKKVVKFVKKAKELNGKLKVKIKALKKGKAKITCKAPSGKKAVCKIVVK